MARGGIAGKVLVKFLKINAKGIDVIYFVVYLLLLREDNVVCFLDYFHVVVVTVLNKKWMLVLHNCSWSEWIQHSANIMHIQEHQW
jgi:hypothetical protein